MFRATHRPSSGA